MFAGFSSEAIQFLRALSRNNRREWFQPRKDQFEAVLRAPMIAAVEGVNAELLKFAPDHITDPKKAIYRIYRDTRFSADKTPYKTHIAAVFPRRGSDRHSSAGFYFQVSPQGVQLAAGAYMPGPPDLYAIRSWLTEHHGKFTQALRKAEKSLGPLQGESLSGSPKGFDPAHPAAELIRRKQWFFWTEPDEELATSPKLVKEIAAKFRAAAPVIAYLNEPMVTRPSPSAGRSGLSQF